MVEIDEKNSKDNQSETLVALGELINIIASQSRLKILFLLTKGELCVCKIYDSLNLSQSLVSHHLTILREYNLVNTRREGRWIYYSINKETLKKLNDSYLAVFSVDKIETEQARFETCK